MIKISKMADYAVVVLATLARSDGALLTASGIASDSGLPEPSVAKLLKLLGKAGILSSTRGASGGYRLAREAGAISVADIVRAVDGPIALTACVDSHKEPCGYESRCPVRGRWDGVNRVVQGALSSITLADMIAADTALPERGAHEQQRL